MKNISDNTILDKTNIDKQDGKVRIFFAIKLLLKRITIKNSQKPCAVPERGPQIAFSTPDKTTVHDSC